MTQINALDAVYYTSFLVVALSVVTWAVLWNGRSLSIHLWCWSGVLSRAFVALTTAMQVYWVVPSMVMFPVVAATGIASVICRLESLLLLRGRPLGGTRLTRAIGAAALVACVLGALPGTRFWFDLMLSYAMLAGLVWSAVEAYRVGRTHDILNARLLALTTGVAALGSASSAIALTVARQNLLTVNTDAVPVSVLAVNGFVSCWNAVLFVGVAFDLQRQQTMQALHALAESRAEQSRLEERARLVDDLHDGFGSQLASARLQAQGGRLSQPALADLLDECMADLYLVVDTMHAPDGTLGDALRRIRHRVQSRLTGQQVRLHWEIDIDGAVLRPHRDTIQILRIVQEALTNALRHAQATTIVVRASIESGRLIVSVSDDGVGFDGRGDEGHGLRSMHARAESLGAVLDIVGLGPGTRVCLRLPEA